MTYPNKRNHVGWYSGFLQCLVSCFLKVLVEILDCHQRKEFRSLSGVLENWK